MTPSTPKVVASRQVIGEVLIFDTQSKLDDIVTHPAHDGVHWPIGCLQVLRFLDNGKWSPFPILEDEDHSAPTLRDIMEDMNTEDLLPLLPNPDNRGITMSNNGPEKHPHERDWLDIDFFEGDQDVSRDPLSNKIVRARKDHKCHGFACIHSIQSGELYRNQVDIVFEKLEEYKWCIRCLEKAMQEWW